MAAAAVRGPFLVRASYHWAVRLDAVLTCSNCPATILEADADYAGWRYRSDGVGELLPFCGFCEYREFRDDAPASTDA